MYTYIFYVPEHSPTDIINTNLYTSLRISVCVCNLVAAVGFLNGLQNCWGPTKVAMGLWVSSANVENLSFQLYVHVLPAS